VIPTTPRKKNHHPRLRSASVLMLATLSGCATIDVDKNLAQTSRQIAPFSDNELVFKRTAEDIAHADALAGKILAEPLDQPHAVQLALINSPAFQSVLAQNWTELADAAQSGRIPNPVFNFERVELGSEIEIGRLLSFGLLDIFTLPARQRIARQRIEIAQIKLTNDVIQEILETRRAWTQAIAAQQNLSYAKQVFESAEASAELARRMESVGNFSRHDRARQQEFYTSAATQLSTATHNVTATRENLIRVLGLNDNQLALMKLPERLPPLPDEPLAAESVSQVARNERLDVKMAEATLQAALSAQGIGPISSYTDIEIGGRHDTIFDDGERANADGYEIDIKLPVFDWGGMKRASMSAKSLAAANQLQATLIEANSGLRESYSAYRTAYDVAFLYQEEILPLQELMAEESVLRYNGMFIGVFELLADSRRQITTVQGAINAAEQFWLAHDALQASILGKPTTSSIVSAGNNGGGDEGGGH